MWYSHKQGVLMLVSKQESNDDSGQIEARSESLVGYRKNFSWNTATPIHLCIVDLNRDYRVSSDLKICTIWLFTEKKRSTCFLLHKWLLGDWVKQLDFGALSHIIIDDKCILHNKCILNVNKQHIHIYIQIYM